MKKFLFFRDNNEELFKEEKKNGGIGIPLIDDNGTLYLSWEEYLLKLGYHDFIYEEAVSACSLDGKGC